MKFTRRDWLWTTALFVVTLALRVPFRSELAYHWDSVQLALGVREYNVVLSQPHAPGYFLYVMLGRLVNLLVGDPHASLVWLSVVFGGVLAALLYLLGVAMVDRRTGIAAGCLGVTSPLLWFHGCVALMYTVDASFACLMVLVCWLAMRGGGTWFAALTIGTLMAVVGGVRQQTAVGLLPLVAYTFWRFHQQRAAKAGVAAMVAALLSTGWFLPMVYMSGGLALFSKVVRMHVDLNAPVTLAGGGWNAFATNLFFVCVYCWNGMLLAAVLVVGGLVYRAFKMSPEHKRLWTQQYRDVLPMLAVWIVPMMLLWTVGVTRQPGHVLSYLPAWLLLAAITVAQLRRKWWFAVITLNICAINTLIFTVGPQSLEDKLLIIRRGAREIRDHDQQLTQAIQAIRSQCDPARTAIFHWNEHFLFGIRHFQYYLPEFDQYQLPSFAHPQMASDPLAVNAGGRPMMRAHNGRLEFVNGIDWTGKAESLLVVPPGEQVDIFEPYLEISNIRRLPGAGGIVYGAIAHGKSLN
jgi:hypothetical protein